MYHVKGFFKDLKDTAKAVLPDTSDTIVVRNNKLEVVIGAGFLPFSPSHTYMQRLISLEKELLDNYRRKEAQKLTLEEIKIPDPDYDERIPDEGDSPSIQKL